MKRIIVSTVNECHRNYLTKAVRKSSNSLRGNKISNSARFLSSKSSDSIPSQGQSQISPASPSETDIPVEESVEVVEVLSIDTILATSGCDPSDLLTGAVTPPIHFASTYERDEDLQFSRGFNYSRLGNPTRNLLEKTFAKLEEGKEAFAFSSGMQAAVSVLISCPGAHVFLPDDLYHGVSVILLDLFAKWGLTFEHIDMTDHKLVKKSLKAAIPEGNDEKNEKKKIILWLETPSNPLCKVTDVKELSAMAKKIVKEENLCVVVDATWSTPYLMRPLTLGADFVLHSTTKYVGGHSDLLGGILVAGNTVGADSILSTVRLFHQVGGGVASPFDSWLALRGLRTLPVRMQQHCSNAIDVAEYLQGHSKVVGVNYPGLVTHPQHRVATEQMGGRCYGGMLSFLVKMSEDPSLPPEHTALQVVKRVKRFKRATSLGGTESLIEHRRSVEGPSGSSPPNLLRLSIGLEDVGDLLADLDRALRADEDE